MTMTIPAITITTILTIVSISTMVAIVTMRTIAILMLLLALLFLRHLKGFCQIATLEADILGTNMLIHNQRQASLYSMRHPKFGTASFAMHLAHADT